jgi:hypothetical protein
MPYDLRKKINVLPNKLFMNLCKAKTIAKAYLFIVL